MPERVNFIDDLPPVAESKNVSTPTLLDASEVVELETVAFLDPFSGEEVVPGSSVPGSSIESTVTISAIDSASYYGMISLFVFFLVAGIAILARRTRVSSSAPKKALLLGGMGMFLLAGCAFASKSIFSQFLNQEIAQYPLMLKPLCWAVIAPVLVMMIPSLVTENPKAQKFFMISAAKIFVAFVILGVGGFLDLNTTIAGAFGAVSLGLGVFFALPLLKALRRLPGNLSEAAKNKISQMGTMVVGISLAQIITGGLMLLQLPISILLLADEVLSFALVGIIFFNLMKYITIQTDEEVPA
ncbi:MAG: hypothetical protein HRU10_01360 [Opitutales bacterium]|nr:hypothetical protein [Opitutales bacterium]